MTLINNHKPAYRLHSYQQEALEGLYNYFASGKGNNPIIIVPTGGGKTYIISALLHKFHIKNPNSKVMIVTHQSELVTQNADTMVEAFNAKEYADLGVGIFSASLKTKDHTQRFTFCNIQSLVNALDLFNQVDAVIIDEAHLVSQNEDAMYNKMISYFKGFNPKMPLIGLTATPYRMDGGRLYGAGKMFDGVAYNVTYKTLLNNKMLSPIIHLGSKDNSIKIDSLKKIAGEYSVKSVDEQVNALDVVDKTCAEINAVSKDNNRNKILIFASSVAHAESLDKAMAQHMETLLIHGGIDKDTQNLAIEIFKTVDDRVCLINVNMLTTGFNVPNIDMIAIVRATTSLSLYVQMVGRGTRKFETKENCLLMDYGQHVSRFGFIEDIDYDELENEKATKKPSKKTKSKTCNECGAFCKPQDSACHYCGNVFPVVERKIYNVDLRQEEKAVYSMQPSKIYAYEKITKRDIKRLFICIEGDDRLVLTCLLEAPKNIALLEQKKMKIPFQINLGRKLLQSKFNLGYVKTHEDAINRINNMKLPTLVSYEVDSKGYNKILSVHFNSKLF